MNKFYVGDLIEDKNGLLWVICYVEGSEGFGLTVPLGNECGWISFVDAKKLSHHPEIIDKLRAVNDVIYEYEKILGEINILTNNENKKYIKMLIEHGVKQKEVFEDLEYRYQIEGYSESEISELEKEREFSINQYRKLLNDM